MSDFVISAPDAPTLLADAKAMGFTSTDVNGNVTINSQGRIPGDPDPLASYFLNVVGQHFEPTGATTTDGMGNTVPVMTAVPGFWARIRLNGDNPFALGRIALPTSLMIYQQVTPPTGSPFWTSDGTTVAPAYVGTIGTIA